MMGGWIYFYSVFVFYFFVVFLSIYNILMHMTFLFFVELGIILYRLGIFLSFLRILGCRTDS